MKEIWRPGTAGGYFRDDPAASRARAGGIAIATGAPPMSLQRLSRRNARVWEIRRANQPPQVLKLAAGRDTVQARLSAAALTREVTVLQAMRRHGLVTYAVSDFGSELGAALCTWLLTGRVAGSRASLVVRNGCPADEDVVDICARTLRHLAGLHRADPEVLAAQAIGDGSHLDRPLHHPPDPLDRLMLDGIRRLGREPHLLVPCHGDTSLHNVVIDTSDLSLVDWACARPGLPSLDIAPVLVWLAAYTSRPSGCADLLAYLPELYRGQPGDPVVGLREHLVRVLLQWAVWRGAAYRHAAVAVARASSTSAAVTAMFVSLNGATRHLSAIEGEFSR